MRGALGVLLLVAGCAVRTPPPGSGPLASPVALPMLREATRLVRLGAYAEAQAVLTRLVDEDGGQAAGEAMESLLEQYDTLPVPDLKVRLAAIVTAWPKSSAANFASSLLSELEVIGRPAAPLVDVTWLQGTGAYADAPLTMLVFWETWCPYCRQELPKLEAMAQAYAGQGLQVLGISKLSRGTTSTDLLAFAAEHGVTFALGAESGTITDAFGVDGVPAVALVHQGEVVWRGHPMMLSTTAVESFLAAE